VSAAGAGADGAACAAKEIKMVKRTPRQRRNRKTARRSRRMRRHGGPWATLAEPMTCAVPVALHSIEEYVASMETAVAEMNAVEPPKSFFEYQQYIMQIIALSLRLPLCVFASGEARTIDTEQKT